MKGTDVPKWFLLDKEKCNLTVVMTALTNFASFVEYYARNLVVTSDFVEKSFVSEAAELAVVAVENEDLVGLRQTHVRHETDGLGIDGLEGLVALFLVYFAA